MGFFHYCDWTPICEVINESQDLFIFQSMFPHSRMSNFTFKSKKKWYIPLGEKYPFGRIFVVKAYLPPKILVAGVFATN